MAKNLLKSNHICLYKCVQITSQFTFAASSHSKCKKPTYGSFRGTEVEVEVYNEEEDKCKNKEKHCKGEAKGK